MAPSRSSPAVTFASQDSLAKLPIPNLTSTCQKYLAALAPLQTAREHDDTAAAVKDFLATDGPRLHAKLAKYAEVKSSYIEQFCEFLLLPYVNLIPVLTYMSRVRLVSQL